MEIILWGFRGRIGSCVAHILGQGNYIGVEIGEELPLNLPKEAVVLSCCPYSENGEIAEWAKNNNYHYADLGGDPNTSFAIQELYKDSNLSCITDLGLAPGLVNIWAEHILQSLANPPKNLTLLCGGLPYDNYLTNSLRYGITWSEQGLYNEYMGECDFLQDGKLGKIPTLQPGPNLKIDDIRYESFSTKGGIANSLPRFKTLGVKNCGYFTIRYEGHLQFIKFLLEECKLTEEEFIKIIQKVCPKTNLDIVTVGIETDDEPIFMQCKYYEPFSAMQIMTALPTAIVVNMIKQGKIIQNYQDVDKNSFWSQFNIISAQLFPNCISIKN